MTRFGGAALFTALCFSLSVHLVAFAETGTEAVAAEPSSTEPKLMSPPASAGSKVELFVDDVGASIEFYKRLDFEVAEQKAYGYTALRRGSFVMALSPLPGWLPMSWLGFLRSPPLGTELVFYVSDLEARHALLEKAGDSPGAIELQSWGDRDFRVDDPDGYYVRVSEGAALPGRPDAVESDASAAFEPSPESGAAAETEPRL